MPFATGPWHTPPQLPDDPEELCLVLLFRQGAHHRYAAMRYTDGWRHQNGEALEAETWVSRWAYITSSVERMSDLPPARALPVESRLFVRDALSVHEQVRMLTAYVAELKGENERLQAELQRAQADAGGPEAAVRAELRRAKGLLKHEQDVRASQHAAYLREKNERTARIVELEQQLAALRAELRKHKPI